MIEFHFIHRESFCYRWQINLNNGILFFFYRQFGVFNTVFSFFPPKNTNSEIETKSLKKLNNIASGDFTRAIKIGKMYQLDKFEINGAKCSFL